MSIEAVNLTPLAIEHTNYGRLTRSPGWQPWRSPAMARQELERANKLFSRRLALRLPLGETVALLRPARPADLSSSTWIELRIDGRTGLIQLESDMVERLCSAVDERLDWQALPTELEGMLLEVAMEPWLEALEQMLGHRIEAVGRRAGLAAGTMQPLHLQIEHDLAISPARLWLEDFDLAAFADAWALRPPEPAPWSWLPLDVARCIARSTLTATELAGLASGDVVMIEATLLPQPRMLLTIGRQLAVLGEIHGETVTAAGELRRIGVLNGVLRAMGDDRPTDKGEGTMAPLDEIPLRIAFELGRMELPLGELRMIDAGYVFPLDKDLGAAVEIRCGDRQIGVGEIVHIEDQLGVRVVKLFDRG